MSCHTRLGTATAHRRSVCWPPVLPTVLALPPITDCDTRNALTLPEAQRGDTEGRALAVRTTTGCATATEALTHRLQGKRLDDALSEAAAVATAATPADTPRHMSSRGVQHGNAAASLIAGDPPPPAQVSASFAAFPSQRCCCLWNAGGEMPSDRRRNSGTTLLAKRPRRKSRATPHGDLSPKCGGAGLQVCTTGGRGG